MMTRTISHRGLRLLAATAAAAVALTLAGCGGGSSGGSPSGTATAPTATGPTTAAPTRPTTPTTPVLPTAVVPRLRSGALPLWPFADGTAVLAWQRAYRSGGHQPWHRSADETALSFTRSYLGYTEVDRVTSRSGSATDMLVGVGWLDPNGKAVTVGRVHLLRFGTAADGPWEVVGTRDDRLTLTRPRYGSTVTSPMTVGGRITGVDESLVISVLTLSSSKPLTVTKGIMVGGEGTPWRTAVDYRAAKGAVLTIAVKTGGHLMGVEEFAVTGVRNSSRDAGHVTWGSTPESGGALSTAPVVGVRAGRHDGYDRLVVDVDGATSGYRVQYVDTLTGIASGRPVPVAGGARLQVVVLSPAYDVATGKETYVPASRARVVDVTGYPALRQVAWLGSFEGRTALGVGVRARLPFRAFLLHESGRTAVVVDVAHTW